MDHSLRIRIPYPTGQTKQEQRVNEQCRMAVPFTAHTEPVLWCVWGDPAPEGITMQFTDLMGKTLVSVENVNNEQIVFRTADESYRLFHRQDCCEEVLVESIIGDFDDLIGTPILLAEEATSGEPVWGEEGSSTWTFYKLRTVKGSVDIRWHGTSNGYYSESVEFEKVS